MAKKDKRSPDANYQIPEKKEPAKRLGEGSFANLPDAPIMKPFGGPVYRDGNINSFEASVSDLSDIRENRR